VADASAPLPERRVIYRGRKLDLALQPVRLADGSLSDREVVVHRGAVALVPLLDDGRKVTAEMVKTLVAEELPKVKAYLGDAAWAAGRYPEAAAMFEQMCIGDYNEFLTLPAYELID
jgi:hypothetical protein